MKLIDTQNRKVLNEGRNYQMGFAFCRQLEEEVFETVQPISPCKDYLNDVYAGEVLQIPVGAYGLSFKPGKPIFTKDRATLTFRIMPYHHGADYPTQAKDKENLTLNIDKIQKFINNFEELFKIEDKSKIFVLEEGFIINFSLQWLKGIYCISLLALLLRVSQWYDGEQSVVEYLEKFNQFAPDVYLVSGNLFKIKSLIETGLIQEDLEKYRGGDGYAIHNNGIHTIKMETLKK